MQAVHRAIARRAVLRSQAAHLTAADAGLSARAAPRKGRGSLSTLAAAAPAQGAEAALKHTPFGERGTGFYTDATRGCFDVLARLEAPVLAAVEAALSRRAAAGDFASPFRIADYGTADGGTSMPLVRKCVLKVRAARGFEATPVEVLYEDQPGNDWVSVFNRTQGLVATPNVPDAARGLGDFENLVVLASGRSFYHPCFSPGSVDVAFCATAFHWLTAMPCVIPDALHSAASQDPVAVKAYMVQADVDWRQILAARSRELKPGCRLVVANFAKDAEGQFLGNTHRTQSMHHCFAELWRGLVTPEEFAATNFPNQYRTLEECTAPFGAEGSGTFAGLKILEAETGVVSCPYLDGYLADPTRRTPTEQALYFHNTTRTWSNSTFVAGLGAGRSHEERTALVDALFAGYVQRIAASPGQHGMDYVHSYLTLERQEGAAVGGGGGGGGHPAPGRKIRCGWSLALKATKFTSDSRCIHSSSLRMLRFDWGFSAAPQPGTPSPPWACATSALPRGRPLVPPAGWSSPLGVLSPLPRLEDGPPSRLAAPPLLGAFSRRRVWRNSGASALRLARAARTVRRSSREYWFFFDCP
mmetsp:Transcript_49008/g.138479  ORF Transcript_49008/g.138479 Transcript_49008/m.138479 type:complete len:586 (-) Transcript_49008:183-1940(-)